MYLLNVPSVPSPYFNKIKRPSHLGKWPAVSLEILYFQHNFFLLLNHINECWDGGGLILTQAHHLE